MLPSYQQLQHYSTTPCCFKTMLLLFLMLSPKFSNVLGEISSAAATTTGISSGYPLTNNLRTTTSHCSVRKFMSILNSIDDVEDLELDVQVNIALDARQKKRFLLILNYSTPLTINFSQNVARKIYFNQTTNLSRSLKSDQRTVLFPCALSGQYDVFLQAKHRGSIKVEAHAGHPQANWPLLNRTNRINIRSQNRVGKRQMIVKWDRSKLDVHAVHYCLIINTKRSQKNFCTAVHEYVTSVTRKGSCYTGPVMDYIWLKPPERAKKIDPRWTNVICTGLRTQQLLKGLAPNTSYFLDIFGVHTKRQNLTFHMASTLVHFNRTHPTALRENSFAIEKLTGLHGVQVFSFKIPAPEEYLQPQQQQQLRYLVLPCGGSEVDIRILKQRKTVGNVSGIYRPTYIKLPIVQSGERYIMRILPSNEDEVLRANKVGLAVTTVRTFTHLPELPENITVFEVRSRCKSSTIAWYSAPEIRTMSYCIIVFNLPHRNRSSVDYTNYCMDFGKRFKQHPLFYSIECTEKRRSPQPLETHTIFNLSPGESYLIYVTANLSEPDGKALPYQSLRVKMSQQCHNELYDSREQTAYY